MRKLAEQLEKGSCIVHTALCGDHMGQTAFAQTEAELPDWARVARPQTLPSIVDGIFCEEMVLRRELILCGGGHISKPVCTLGHLLGYRVTVIDDRPDFANAARFPEAARVVCAAFDDVLPDMPEHASYIIVTRGHRDDSACLAQILRKQFTYCGMIGSETKVRTVMQRMRDAGFSERQLARVHSPIGLKIGAHTPEEIAVSIAAELIQVHSVHDSSVLPKEIAQTLRSYPGKMVMVTIVRREGSAPRGVGARMLLCDDGSVYGTIGGGSVEHAAQQRASLLFDGSPALEHYELGGGEASHLGMICGGRVDVLFAPIEARR